MSMLEITYDADGQTITCPHRDEAVPSAAVNITILDDAGTELLASTAATKGALASTVATTALSVGARSAVLAAVTGVSVGDPVVFTASDGSTELRTVDGVDSATKTITWKDRLRHTYAIGDSVKSALITYDADLTEEDDFPLGTHYQAWFSCDDWDSDRVVLFRVVKAQSANPIEYADVVKWITHISTLQDSYDDENLREYRDSAWLLIKAKVRAAGRDPAVWRDAPDSAPAGGLLTAALFLLAHGEADLAVRYAGDPPGEGGLFLSHWRAVGIALGWFDVNQNNIREGGETKTIRSTYVGRGL